jgi:hypothetical protein
MTCFSFLSLLPDSSPLAEFCIESMFHLVSQFVQVSSRLSFYGSSFVPLLLSPSLGTLVKPHISVPLDRGLFRTFASFGK